MIRRFLRAVRESGLRRALNAVLNYGEFELGRRTLVSVPVAMDLEITSRCPLACNHCPRTHRDELELPFPIKDMEKQRALDILRSLKGVRRVNFQGYGEPLLCGHLFEVIAEARNLGIHTSFSTSASVLTERILEGFRTSPPHHLTFSCDVVDERLEEGIRENMDLGKFRSGVARIVEAVNAAGQGTSLLFHTCLIGTNYHQLSRVVEFAAEVGVPQVDVSELNLSYLEHIKEQVLPDDRQAAHEAVRVAQRLGESLGVVVGFLPQQDRPPARKGWCRYLWQHPYVDVEGRVTPCCARPFAGKFSVGTIPDQTLGEVWNGEEMQKLRDDHLAGRCPDLCRGCPYAPVE